jgi:peptide/nickel transport system substrate-binding protein
MPPRAAFAAAGITDLVAITYTTAMQYNPAGGQALAESLQGYLAKCGVSLTINSYDWATFRTKRKEEYFDLGFYGWAGDNGDPDNFMNLFASTSGVASMSHFADDTYDRLVEEGIRTPDGSARDDIYHQLEKRLAQLLPCLPLSHAKTVCAYKPSVTGFTMHPHRLEQARRRREEGVGPYSSSSPPNSSSTPRAAGMTCSAEMRNG